MAEIHIDVDDANARQALRRLNLMLSDLRPFWPLVVPIFSSWMRRQFDTEGTFAGTRWAPLSQRYGLWKNLRYPGKPILQLTGAMKRAASDPIRHATPTVLTLTIRDPKLGYHQEGTPEMPARPLVFEQLPLVARRELERAAERYVEDFVRSL